MIFKQNNKLSTKINTNKQTIDHNHTRNIKTTTMTPSKENNNNIQYRLFAMFAKNEANLLIPQIMCVAQIVSTTTLVNTFCKWILK